MTPLRLQIDPGPFEQLLKAWSRFPNVLADHLAAALREIGQHDMRTLRQKPGDMRIRRQALLKAFKAKSTDASRANLSNLFLVEYCGWAASEILQKGGKIDAKKRALTVLLPAGGRNGDGSRKFQRKVLADMAKNGQLRIMRNKRTGNAIVIQELPDGRKLPVAVLKKYVIVAKHLEFFENFQRNAAEHDRIMAEQAQAALQTLQG